MPQINLQSVTDFPKMEAKPTTQNEEEESELRKLSIKAMKLKTFTQSEQFQFARGIETKTHEEWLNLLKSIEADVPKKFKSSIEFLSTKGVYVNFTVRADGTPELHKVRDYVLGLLQSYTMEEKVISVPKKYHGGLIGKQGAKISTIKSLSGVRGIFFPKIGVDSGAITLVGGPYNISKAIELIKLATNEMDLNERHVFEVKKEYKPFIRGPNGSNVKDWESKMNVKILMGKANEDNIILRGANVDDVRKELEEIIDDLSKNFFLLNVNIPPEQQSNLIGTKGIILNKLMSDYKVHINVPPRDSDSSDVQVSGLRNNVVDSIGEILSITDHLDITMDVPTWFAGGNTQNYTQKILDELNLTKNDVSVEQTFLSFSYTDEPSRSFFHIKGKPDLVKKVQEWIKSKISQMEKKYHIKSYVKPETACKLFLENKDKIEQLKEKYELDFVTTLKGFHFLSINEAKLKEAAKLIDGQMKLLETQTTKEIRIDGIYHPQLIGVKGRRISDIRETFPDVKNEVERCAKHLLALVEDFKSKTSIEVPIVKQFHRHIVGKNGSKLNEIQRETNTVIRSSMNNADDFVISGRKKDCEIAKKKLEEIEAKYASIGYEKIKIPNHLHDFITKQHPIILQDINSTNGNVRIIFPPENSTNDVVTLRGVATDVKEVAEGLTSLAERLTKSTFNERLAIPTKYHVMFFDRKKYRLQNLRERFNVFIYSDIGLEQNEISHICAVGEEKNVGEAIKHMKELMEKFDSIISETMRMDKKYQEFFQSRSNKDRKIIEDECNGVEIRFNEMTPHNRTNDDDVEVEVIIRGVKEDVEKAKHLIDEKIEFWKKNFIQETLELSDVGAKTLLKRSSKDGTIAPLRSIELENDVVILLNRTNPSGNEENSSNHDQQWSCEVNGTKDNVSKANDDLKAVIPSVKAMTVPKVRHAAIIGTRGQTVNELQRQFNVRIMCESNDIIRVTGQGANVDKAIEKISEISKEWEIENYEEKYQIDVNILPKLLLNNGAFVKDICDTVYMRFPSKAKNGQEQDDFIVIRGRKENVAKAIEQLNEVKKKVVNVVEEQIEIEKFLQNRVANLVQHEKLTKEFNVDIIFAPSTARGEEEDIVRIIGEANQLAIVEDRLLLMAEDVRESIAQSQPSLFTREEEKRLKRLDIAGKSIDNIPLNNSILPGDSWEKYIKAAPKKTPKNHRHNNNNMTNGDKKQVNGHQ
ncbi:hypothetical protein SNEBB_009789 [Seison nebaliae]|nr:hypothetical protein SNEBB_009789 [Seison nebaliae]